MKKVKRNQNGNSFRQIVEKVGPANARRLIERAQTANRLAKSLRGKARANAYAVKTEALLAPLAGMHFVY